jgi:hypothetical protein
MQQPTLHALNQESVGMLAVANNCAYAVHRQIGDFMLCIVKIVVNGVFNNQYQYNNYDQAIVAAQLLKEGSDQNTTEIWVGIDGENFIKV